MIWEALVVPGRDGQLEADLEVAVGDPQDAPRVVSGPLEDSGRVGAVRIGFGVVVLLSETGGPPSCSHL